MCIRDRYLNSFYIDRRYYLPYGSITRVFKRVAMSSGGFSGKGVFASMAYLAVSYTHLQAPFYVAICASLLQIYQKSENSIRLVLLDEAFSKMTSDMERLVISSEEPLIQASHSTRP